MTSFKTLLTAAAVSVALGSSAFAESAQVKFGSQQCAADTKECTLFLRSMTDEELREKGLSLSQLVNLNTLVDFQDDGTAPAFVWFSTRD
jgi:hypothetical protein